MVTRTKFVVNALDTVEAIKLYETLKNKVKWEEGVRSKNGFTRKAKTLDMKEVLEDYPEVYNCIGSVLPQFGEGRYAIFGVYLNFYEDGKMYTPNHSHSGTQQLVISLGVSRILTVGKKNFIMNNGSAILFGSSVHGVPKEPEITEGRISIATFMKKI